MVLISSITNGCNEQPTYRPLHIIRALFVHSYVCRYKPKAISWDNSTIYLFYPLFKVGGTFSCKAPECTPKSHRVWNYIICSLTCLHESDRYHLVI
jgi:hypothetical protein